MIRRFLQYKGVPKFLTNFYILYFIIFGIWYVFLAESNLLLLIERIYENVQAQKELKFYTAKKAEVTEDIIELHTNKRLIEKYAREKYFLHRENEDVYVIVKKKKAE